MWFRDPFGASRPQKNRSDQLTVEELAVLHGLAAELVSRRLTVPVIMTLESLKPLNWVGSQSMIVLEPLAQPMLSALGSVWGPGLISKLGKNYGILQSAMEKREAIETLIQKIEELDAEAYRKEKENKKERKGAGGGFLSRFKRNREKGQA